MKSLSLGVALACLALVPSGCKSSSDGSGTDQLIQGEAPVRADQHTGSGDARPTVALVMKTLTNPFFKTMEEGARRAERELGIRLVVKTGAKETSLEQQIDIIEQLIADRVDAIVIAPGSSTELIPALAKAHAAGIVIINVDNRLDPELSRERGLTGVPFISVDNEAGAYLAAKFLADKVSQPTQALLFEGIRTADNARARARGAARALAENPKIELVAQESANWNAEEAHHLAEELFRKYPGVGLVFCANDMMAVGVMRFLEEHQRSDVLVGGFDALDVAKKAVSDGTLQVTIDQQPGLQGQKGVEYAVRALRGETLPPETLVDVMVVTRESL